MRIELLLMHNISMAYRLIRYVHGMIQRCINLASRGEEQDLESREQTSSARSLAYDGERDLQ